jgi:LCP family protein required for cell wall assembly
VKRALSLILAIGALLAGCSLLAPVTPPAVTPAPSPTPMQAGDMNLLLLGTDRRQTSPDWRTDTLIVVAVRPKEQLVAMLSIPRDLWVNIPGYGPERINAADYLGEKERSGGGPALVAATLKENLGIRVDAYAQIDFAGLERIIDAVGGVDVNVPRPIDDWIDEGDGRPPVHVTIAAGPQHLDGRTALQYVRSRHGTTDMDRSQRQQQVLLALRDAAARPEMVPRLPWLASTLAGMVKTNLRPADALALLDMALHSQPQSFRTRVFDATMVSDWTTPSGAMVLLPDRDRIEEVWTELTAPASP